MEAETKEKLIDFEETLRAQKSKVGALETRLKIIEDDLNTDIWKQNYLTELVNKSKETINKMEDIRKSVQDMKDIEKTLEFIKTVADVTDEARKIYKEIDLKKLRKIKTFIDDMTELGHYPDY